jgi:hypothetical protein
MFCTQLREAFSDVLDCRSVVACGVGLDYGDVVMAQCGSQGMTEYVVAGEVSARVMEVEALTRDVGRAIVVTEPVADRLSANLRNTGIVPCPQGVDGVPCYGILGEDWELDILTIKANIRKFHDTRAALAKEAEAGDNGCSVPVKKSRAVSRAGRGSVASYASDPNEVLDARMAEEVFEDACAARGEAPILALKSKLRQGVDDDRMDLARALQGPHELGPLTMALKHLSHLRSLNMSDNFIDDNNLTDIVECCLSMKDLQVLDLSNNPGITKILTLKRLVKHNTSIKEIVLNGTRIAPTEQRKLQSSINVNRLCASGSDAGNKSHKYEHSQSVDHSR